MEAAALRQRKPSAGEGPRMACPNCEATNPKHFKFCGACGYPLAVPPSIAKGSKPAPPPPPSAETRGQLVLVRPDGTDSEGLPLTPGETVIGRDSHPGLQLDHYLSPQHASFTWRDNKLEVRDLDSKNGVYKRIKQDDPYAIQDGDIFRIGQHILTYERIPAVTGDARAKRMGTPLGNHVGRLRLIIGPEIYGNAFLLPDGGLFLGRERGDVLFPDDGYVSGLHCRVHPRDGGAFVTDLGSSNGTFVRLRKPDALQSGDHLLLGLQLMRVAVD